MSSDFVIACKIYRIPIDHKARMPFPTGPMKPLITIAVVNLNKRIQDERGFIYIGRPGPYGNPYRIGKDGDRGACIELFKRYLKIISNSSIRHPNSNLLLRLETEMREMIEDEKIHHFKLGCWCAPEPCHGDILKQILEERLNK